MKITRADRATVARIIGAIDEQRIGHVGGYYSEWLIERGVVYWATLDEAKEYLRPVLYKIPVHQFIETYRWALEVSDAEASA